MRFFSSLVPSMRKANRILEKCMVILTPTGVILGLLLGKNISWMKPAVNYLFGFLTFTSAISIDFRDFCSTVKKPRFFICFAVCSVCIMPLLALAIGVLFFSDSVGIRSGYALIRSIPTAVVGTVWASIFAGNMGISLSILIIDTIIAPFVTPFLLSMLVKSSIPLDTSGMMKSLFFMVVMPSMLGMLVNQITNGKINDEVGPCLKPVSKIFLLFVITVNTSQVAESLIANASSEYLVIAIASLILALSGYIVGFVFSLLFKFNYEDSVSITFSVAMRNVSAALVLAIAYLPPEGALPVIFGIVFQQSASAIMGHFLFARKQKVIVAD